MTGPSMTTTPPADDELACLHHYLRTRDEPCPRCGYNLRHLQNSACPECGSALCLKVGLVEPRLAPYITLLLAAGTGLGGGILLLLVAVFRAPLDWWETPAALLLEILTGLTAPVLALALFLRRKICRRSQATQWVLASFSWIVILMLAIAIIALFDG